MNTPFIFGKLAVNQNFTDRTNERNQLIGNFNSLINTIMISPRRWGKSSLVLMTANEAQKKNKTLHFCFLDAFSVRSEEQFYQHLAIEVLKASASKMDVLLNTSRKFLGKFLPQVSFGPDPQNSISLSLNWKEVIKHPDDILNMAENIAKEKGWKFIICIDEFQNIATFNNPLAFQKKLRSLWQKHQHVAYCLYGSKRHMLMDIFTKSSMPFYKFGDLIFLDKIKKDDWIPFLCKNFEKTQKQITKEDASLIADLAECHPYYVQQLAQQSWLRTEIACSSEIVKQAHEGIIDQLSLLFQTKTDELTTPQLYFLKALIDEVDKLSSKETLKKYKMGTSANVQKIKKTLENKEIIDILGKNISILDPMYKSWLKRWYFKD